MSLFTVPMRRITAVVLESKSSFVVHELLRLGVLDFIHIETLDTQESSTVVGTQKLGDTLRINDLRNRIESLNRQGLREYPGVNSLEVSKLKQLDVSAYSQYLDHIVSEVQLLREQQKSVNQNLLRYDELLQYCRNGQLEYLDIRVGRAERGDLETLRSRLASFAHMVIDAETEGSQIVLTLRRDGSQTTPILDKFGWTESVDVGEQRSALKSLIEALQDRQSELLGEIERLKGAVVERIQSDATELDDMWSNLRLHELVAQIEANFIHTRNTTIFSGWVPAASAEALEEAIRRASENQCVIEWTEAKSLPREQIPVAVQEIPALSPFQKMVEDFHVPEYGTINPTPFVAFTYMAMFGLMFGDALQGLVILLFGLFKTLSFKRKGIEDGSGRMITPNLSRLFIFLGIASMITGVLFGSYFGYPLFKPLWFDYHSAVMGGPEGSALARDVYWILGLTIKFGIFVIALGLALNWINLIRKRDWFPLLFDKNGVIAGWIFGVGVWASFYFVGSGYKAFPTGRFLPIALAVPLILMLFKIPSRELIFHKKTQSQASLGALIMEAIMDWVVDLLEIFSGFLANTLSFMRVAGLGIAHVSLMTAFIQIAALVGGGIPGLLVMIAGNALVIALEGLSAGIQSLRLNYYEFFSKYYTKKGYAYNPVSLRSRMGVSESVK